MAASIPTPSISRVAPFRVGSGLARGIHFSIAATLLVTAARAQKAGNSVPALNPETAGLVCVNDPWTVWVTTTDAGLRYCVQRIGAKTATLVYQAKRREAPRQLATVLADGTAILAREAELTWAALDGTVRTEAARVANEDCRVLGLHPDGAVLERQRPKRVAPTWFVPFRGRGLDVDARVEIRAENEGGVGWPPFRRGNRFGWMEAEMGGPTKVWLFDLQSRKRTETVARSATTLAGIGGKVAWSWKQLVGMDDGSIVDLAYVEGMFAVRRRIAYSLFLEPEGDQFRLLWTAVDLDASYFGERKTVLAEAKVARLFDRDGRVYVAGGDDPPPFGHELEPLVTDAGLSIWNGTGWITIPWLDAFPKAPASGGAR